MIILILCLKVFKKILKKIIKENNALKKVIFINNSIINKAFLLIYNIQIKKLFGMIFSCTFYGALNAE